MGYILQYIGGGGGYPKKMEVCSMGEKVILLSFISVRLVRDSLSMQSISLLFSKKYLQLRVALLKDILNRILFKYV